jgi:hypothetical protein
MFGIKKEQLQKVDLMVLRNVYRKVEKISQELPDVPGSGSPIGCSDCGHYPLREATLRAYNSFWEKHREDLNQAETEFFLGVVL